MGLEMQDSKISPHRPRGRRLAWRRLIVASVGVVMFLLWLGSSRVTMINSLIAPTGARSRPDSLGRNPSKTAEDRRVPLEAHIMSKCPDARDCLHDLILPTMQKIGDKVSFRLSFIGTLSDIDDGVACKHGPSECLGNMIELCAADKYPDPKIYLGFTMCLTRDYRRIPDQDLIEDCALEHGLDFDQLNECVSRDDGYGIGLLRDSVQRTAEAGVTRSCTIRLNEEIRCVRDGGEWKNCIGGHQVDDLVADVERLYPQHQKV